MKLTGFCIIGGGDGSCPDNVKMYISFVVETFVSWTGDGLLTDDEIETTYVFCLQKAETSCAVNGGSAGRLTWWDGNGKLVRQVECSP